MRKRIIVSGIGKRNKLLSLLKEEARRYGLEVVGLDANRLAPARFEVENFFQVERVDNPSFEKKYQDFTQGSLAFMSLIDTEICPITHLYEQAKIDSVFCLHPHFLTCLECEDKLTFAKKLEESRLPFIPTSELPIFSPPFISKDRKGSCASGFKMHLDDHKTAKIQDDNNSIIFQPYCDGIHYCIDAFFSLITGSLVDLCVKQVLVKQAGESYLLQSVDCQPFIDLVINISRALPLRGIVNFDIYDWNGSLSVMEINCRIGGNYPASHAIGVNLLGHMIQEMITGHPANPFSLTGYQKNIVIAKYIDFSEPIALQ